MFLYKRLFRFALVKSSNYLVRISMKLVLITLMCSSNSIFLLIIMIWIVFTAYNIVIHKLLFLNFLIIFFFSYCLFHLISENGITFSSILLLICNIITLIIVFKSKKKEKFSIKEKFKKLFLFILNNWFKPKTLFLLAAFILFSIAIRNNFLYSIEVSNLNSFFLIAYLISSTMLPIINAFTFLLIIINYFFYSSKTDFYNLAKDNIVYLDSMDILYIIIVIALWSLFKFFLVIDLFTGLGNVYLKYNWISLDELEHNCNLGEDSSNLNSTNHSHTTKYCPIGKRIIKLETDRLTISNLESKLRFSNITCFDLCKTIPVDSKGIIICDNNPFNYSYINKHNFVYKLAEKLAKLISIEVIGRTRNVLRTTEWSLVLGKFNVDVKFGDILENLSDKEKSLLVHIFKTNPSLYSAINKISLAIDPNAYVCNHRIGLTYPNTINHLGLDKAYPRNHYSTYKIPLPGTLQGVLYPSAFKPAQGPSRYEGYDAETWDIINSWRSGSSN